MIKCNHEWYAIEQNVTPQEREKYNKLVQSGSLKEPIICGLYDKICIKCHKIDRSNSIIIKRCVKYGKVFLKEYEADLAKREEEKNEFNNEVDVIREQLGIKFIRNNSGNYENLSAWERTQAAMRRTYG